MSARCSAESCKNRKEYDKEGDITFHRFPLNNPPLLKQWLAAIGRSNWTPSRTSFICSAHFHRSAYTNEDPYVINPRLKTDAVPTLKGKLGRKKKKVTVIAKEEPQEEGQATPSKGVIVAKTTPPSRKRKAPADEGTDAVAVDLPKPKRIKTDISNSECLICQQSTNEMLVVDSDDYKRLLKAIRKKAAAGDVAMKKLKKLIGNNTPDSLKKSGAMWHQSCIMQVTKVEKKAQVIKTPKPRAYDGEKCFFCTQVEDETMRLNKLKTEGAQKTLKRAINLSKVKKFKEQLNRHTKPDGTLKPVYYHKKCWLVNVLHVLRAEHAAPSGVDVDESEDEKKIDEEKTIKQEHPLPLGRPRKTRSHMPRISPPVGDDESINSELRMKYEGMLQNAQQQISKLKQRCEALEICLDKYRNINSPSRIIQEASKHVTLHQLSFIEAQILNSQKPQHLCQWSKYMRDIAVGLYYESPSAYMFLGEIFALPSLKEVKSWVAAGKDFGSANAAADDDEVEEEKNGVYEAEAILDEIAFENFMSMVI